MPPIQIIKRLPSSHLLTKFSEPAKTIAAVPSVGRRAMCPGKADVSVVMARETPISKRPSTAIN